MNVIGYELKTPWTPMSVLVDIAKQPVVIGASFLSMSKFLAKSGNKLDVTEYKKDPKLAGVSQVIKDWIDGDLNAFRKLKVRQPGGEFMQACWKELHKVKGGTVITYAQLAQLAGRPLAVRAAGTACSSNLIAPIVPCHRVVKTSGGLGNYGFGLTLKAALLEHEGIEL